MTRFESYYRSSRARSLARRALQAAGLVLLAVGTWACTGGGESLEYTGGDASFNPWLREDLAPISASDEADPREFIRAGIGGGLIDTLVPTEMPIDHPEQLKRARTFWTAGGGLDLSYEFMMFEPEWNGRRPTLSEKTDGVEQSEDLADFVGYTPKFGLTDVKTRRLVLFDGNAISTANYYVPELANYTIALEHCGDGDVRGDSDQAPGRFDQGCTRQAMTIESCNPFNDLVNASTYFPYTVMRCSIPGGVDGSYKLEAVQYPSLDPFVNEFPAMTHEPYEIETTIRPIRFDDGSRLMARELTFQEEGCFVKPTQGDERPCAREDEDPGDGAKFRRAKWEWQVHEDPITGWWDENFSSRLEVRKAYLFTQDPEQRGLAGRSYLDSQGISKLVVGEDVQCPVDVDDAGKAFFDLAACDTSIVVTPTYDHAKLSDVGPVVERLKWKPRFQQPGLGTNVPPPLPVDSRDRVFIEFEVANVGRVDSDRVISIDPPVHDFGDVDRGSFRRHVQAIKMTNLGEFSERVEDIRVMNSNDFFAVPSDGRSTPFVLPPGEEVELTVGFEANHPGSHEAILAWDLRQNGRGYIYNTVLKARTVYSDGGVQPGHLGFDAPAGTGLHNPTPRIRRFLVESTGLVDLTIVGISIAGEHAHHFSILESTTPDRASDQGSPLPVVPTKIRPGDAWLLAVVYHPTESTLGQEPHRAQVVVESDKGLDYLDLIAVCDNAPRDCDYAMPPAAP